MDPDEIVTGEYGVLFVPCADNTATARFVPMSPAELQRWTDARERNARLMNGR